MRIAFTNIGCKLNQAELDEMARIFANAGHEIVPSVEDAEIHVVNSCTVTHVAARDSRKVARRGRRRNPLLKTVLTGCYVSAEPEAAAALAGVDLVVSNTEKETLLERLHETFPECVPPTSVSADVLTPHLAIELGHSRALVKIEDGCNMNCSFCIIPFTRGRQQSRDPLEVVTRVQRLEAMGYREVIITGVQISSYRSNDLGLFELVQSILASTDSIRLRLTSIAPWEFDPRLLELFDSKRLCRHFHLSLQSGCAATLRRMRRPYSPEQFLRLADQIQSEVPGVALTTDIIVGFPGETDREFERSLEFAKKVEFARVHAFPYSQRPGTQACDHPNQLPHPIKRERMRRMLEMAQDSQIRFQDLCLNTETQVLWEDEREGYWIGTSDNYLRVRSGASADLSGRITTVLLTASDANGMWGRQEMDETSARQPRFGRTGTGETLRSIGNKGASRSLARL